MLLILAFVALATTLASPIRDNSNVYDISEHPDWSQFQTFVETHHRRYSNQAEVAGRFQIFQQNLKLIEQRNKKGTENHGINKYADIHVREFNRQTKGYKPRRRSTQEIAKRSIYLDFGHINNTLATTKAIDWRSKGAVSAVKNQGQCGSCWAFSATEQIESDHFLQTGTLPILAPQQIVSCDTTDSGCDGGNPSTAYEYVESTVGGLEPSKDYPYTSGTTETNGVCASKAKDETIDITSWSIVSQTAKGESNMLKQIEKSPISICVDATIWQTYVSGIITSKSDCGIALDHCVQAVGYNSKKKYWIVRNSWGTDWGNDGYIYVQAGKNNCGIALEATVTSK